MFARLIVSTAQYLADVDAHGKLLGELTGERSLDARTWKLFRYPSLIEGVDAESRTAIRRGLLGCGYRIAPVTVDFYDWA